MSEALLNRNDVSLAGRISGEPEVRTLPSGDEIVTFRLVVKRPASATRRSRQRVDTIECVAWTAKLRGTVGRWKDGDQVQVTGALRRRFQRSGAGAQSWYGVELTSCKRARLPQ